MKKLIILIKIFLNRISYKCFYGEKVRIWTLQSSGSFTFDITYNTIDTVIIESVNFRKYCSIRMRNKAYLHIGKGVFFNSFCSINCFDNIKIGDNCIFGENVKMYDHDHIFTSLKVPFRDQGYKSSPIVIGNNCWIGSNVTILKGVTIGDNVVISSDAKITENIPSDTIVKSTSNLIIENIRWRDQ